MKPKPSYDWVVNELEKAGVRDIKMPKGVLDRSGRGGGGDSIGFRRFSGGQGFAVNMMAQQQQILPNSLLGDLDRSARGMGPAATDIRQALAMQGSGAFMGGSFGGIAGIPRNPYVFLPHFSFLRSVLEPKNVRCSHVVLLSFFLTGQVLRPTPAAPHGFATGAAGNHGGDACA